MFILGRCPCGAIQLISACAWGETEGSFAMTDLAGIVCLFFFAAALLTSCDPVTPQQQAVLILPDAR